MKLTIPNGIIIEGKYEEVMKACKELHLISKDSHLYEPDHVHVQPIVDDHLPTGPKMPWDPTVIYGTEK